MRVGGQLFATVTVTALVLAAAGCTSSGPATTAESVPSSAVVNIQSPAGSVAVLSATFRVDPAVTLLDEPVNISLSGLPAGAQVTVTAEATDVDGTGWKSSARFAATPTGTVSLAQPPTDNSYRGSNSMALFELMVPTSTTQAQIFRAPAVKSFPVAFAATVNGRVIARAVVNRETYLAKGVTTRTYQPATSGIYGSYFGPPPTDGRKPALLLFGGSEGGNSSVGGGKVFAAQGIPTLTLAYFGEPGLPSTLTDIPLEYFQKALTILAAQPGVDPGKIYVWGISRGSEAALLLGVHYPELVHGVVAGSPSVLVFGNYPNSGQPAWTLQGRAVPFASNADFASHTTNPTDDPAAVIPVRQIKGPIFSVCGDADTVWSSCTYAAAITKELTASHSSYPHIALSYPAAGHAVGAMAGYVSLTSARGGGGTILDNAAALADSHPKLLAFLRS